MKKYICKDCGEQFTETDLREFREMGEAYHQEKGGFVCPDCWDSFQRLTLEDQAAILIEKEGCSMDDFNTWVTRMLTTDEWEPLCPFNPLIYCISAYSNECYTCEEAKDAWAEKQEAEDVR